MKTVHCCLLSVLVILAASCGGKKDAVVPRHVSAGAEQIAKGMPFSERGCYARALEHFSRAQELCTAVGDSRCMAMSANNIGVAYRAMGEAGAAIPFFEDALRLYRRLGDPGHVRQTLSNLAAAQVDAGDYASAGKNIDEVLGIEAPPKPFVPAMTVKGILLARQGDLKGAEATLREALGEIRRRDPEGGAAAHSAMGEVLLGQARYGEAVPFFEKALALDRKAGFYRGIADGFAALGLCHAGMKDDVSAVHAWEQSVRIYALLGMQEKVKSTMALLEEAAKRSNRDIGLTRALAERWLRGEMTGSLCE
ncbi:MAG: tetratricopeptide repeat protein [Syntrophaceae bacterium]|nr:tetratricopeptide repeat protein [Syntrophaceae bacterium]